MKGLYLFLISLAALFPYTAHSAERQSVAAEKFFKGNTITWMVASTPGGDVDRIARLVAPYLQKYTGARIIIQNRPGGSGSAGFNYLYKNAKRDGLYLGSHLASSQMLRITARRPGFNFDLEKFSWIGIMSPAANTLLTYTKRFKSLEDVIRADRVRWGLTRPGGNSHFQGIALAKVLGIKVHFIPGYPGSAGVRQALLSGEVDAAAYPPNLFLSGIKEGIVVPLVHMGRNRHPAIPDTPTIFEIIKKIPSPMDSWVEIGRVGHFLAGPPGIPQERLQFLRAALKKSVFDSDFLKDAKKQQFIIDYVAPDEALKIATRFLAQPEADKDKLRQLLKLQTK